MRFWVESKAFEFFTRRMEVLIKNCGEEQKGLEVYSYGSGWYRMVGGYDRSSIKAGRNSDFTKHLHEGNEAFVAQRCSNVHDRYLPITESGGGGRQSVVVILEGYEGLG